MRLFVLNTGGTLGMVGNPLRPAMSAEDLLDGISVPPGMELVLEDFPLRQDSTNVSHGDRLEMCETILRVYRRFDAFVILHGTDTLAETCAFISMAFGVSLTKPVFVIGAQMTKDNTGSDVSMQIENTLRIARLFADQKFHDVFNVCMGDVLLGTRVRKRNDSDFSAFYTPGVHPVAHVWPHISMRHDFVARQRSRPVSPTALPVLNRNYEKNIVSFGVSADIPPSVLIDVTKTGRIRGVLLECKGIGNIPTVKWDFGEREGSYSWVDAIRRVTARGVYVAVMSPFEDGRVDLTRYELGMMAKEAGAISCASLTPPMADVKLRQAIAMQQEGLYRPARVEDYLVHGSLGENLEDFSFSGY